MSVVILMNKNCHETRMLGQCWPQGPQPQPCRGLLLLGLSSPEQVSRAVSSGSVLLGTLRDCGRGQDLHPGLLEAQPSRESQ